MMNWQGSQIKALAKEKNLTLKSLAEEVGVSRQALNDWTKNQTPKGGHLLKLCKVLGVTPEVFFRPEINSRITLPKHRTRKNAKLNETMQGEAMELASRYELCFRKASDPGLVQSLRIYKKGDGDVRKAAAGLRKLSGVEDDEPMKFQHVFHLLKELGVNLIFSSFPERIKAYAFYTKINNHRVVYVNFDTRIIDLIFAVLHEAIHSIRDENDVYENDLTYNKEEEDFCDEVASRAQFGDGYFSFMCDAISGLNPQQQISKLAGFALKHKHSLHAVNKRIKTFIPQFNLNLYPTDARLRKESLTVKEKFFSAKDARGYVEAWRDVSPVFTSHIIEQSDKLSARRIGELLAIESELDAMEAKKELARMHDEG